jgi:hypothetical protein
MMTGVGRQAKASHARHRQVEADQIGLPLVQVLEQLLAGAGNADHLDPRIGAQNAHHGLADEDRVIDDDDPDGRHTQVLS